MKNRKKEQQKKDWLDWWLNDDESPKQPEPADHEPFIPDAHGTNVSVNVPIPTIDKAKISQLKSRLPQSSVTQVAIFAAFMMLAGLATHSFIFKPPAHTVSSNGQQVLATSFAPGQSNINSISIPTGSGDSSDSQTSSNIPFKPVVPAITALNASTVNYNSGTGVYSYQDNILGKALTISEQPIPTIYKNTSDGLTKIAASVGANQEVDTNNGKAYIYTNPTSGQQTVVFFMNSLYIYINSNISHSSTVWKAYINTLR